MVKLKEYFAQKPLRDRLFNQAPSGNGLGRKSVKGGITSVGAQGANFILTTVGTMVLARLLTPEDYGIVGMANVLMELARMFMTAGLGMATVQQKEISHEQISSLFWINAAIGLTISICVCASAPLFALFYEKKVIAYIVATLSIKFFIGSLTIQHSALMRRHMSFGRLALINIIGVAFKLVLTVIFAVAGYSFWALVLGDIISTALISFLVFASCPWVPTGMKMKTGIRSMLKFGGNLTAFNFINYFSRNLDNLLIGKYLGASELGLYAKAYGLFMLPINQIRNPITDVALPALSALRGNKERYSRYYNKLIDILASISIPVTVYCALEAKFIIQLVLGEKWLACVPVFRILAVTGIIQTVASTRGLVLISHGFSGKYLRWGIINAIITAVSFILGLPHGIEGVALGYCLANYIILIPSLFYCFHTTPVKVSSFIQTLTPSIIISALAAMVVFSLREYIASDHMWSHLAYLITYGITYISISMLRRTFRESITYIIGNSGIMKTSNSHG